MPKVLALVLTFIFNKYYKAKEALKYKALTFALKDENEPTPLSDEDLLSMLEDAEKAVEAQENEKTPNPTSEDIWSGKLVTFYIPNYDEKETMTVATFPVNKYLAEILDSNNEEYEPYKYEAIKTVIGTVVDAKEYSMEWEEMDDDYDDEY